MGQKVCVFRAVALGVVMSQTNKYLIIIPKDKGGCYPPMDLGIMPSDDLHFFQVATMAVMVLCFLIRLLGLGRA